MFIINQDRDEMVKLGDEALYVQTLVDDNKLRGFDLMFGDTSIGFFDTKEEAENELQEILHYDKEYYVVSGYADYDNSEEADIAIE